LQEAEEILSAIIVISKSETEGLLPDGTPTLTERYKEKMKLILTQSISLEENFVSLEDHELDLDVRDVNNMYGEWANNIYRKLLNVLIDNGDRANAHFYPSLIDRILRDIKWYPLWSCICVRKFGYGRIPASSSVVESEFNNIKCRLFANALPTRADLFVFRHIDYINGRIKLVDAQSNNIPFKKENLKIIKKESNKEQPLSVNETPLGADICLACESGDKPANKYLCIVCNILVHNSSECSKIFDNEDYNMQRICTSCQNIPKTDILNAIDSNEVENWRGLSLRSAKKKSRYLEKNNIVFDSKETKLRNIPILLNGNNINLKPINIKGKKMSIIQTCAFDNIFQIFLISLFQSEHFKMAVSNISDSNSFLQIILDTFKNGLTKHIYYLRCVLMSDIFQAKETYDNCFLVNCETSIGYLCRKLFYNICSVKEITSCNTCGNKREKIFPTINVKLEELLESTFPSSIENNFQLKPKRCHQKNMENIECIGIQSTEISEVGKYD